MVDAASHDYASENLTDKRYFRRTVYSSPSYHKCKEIRDAAEVRINPLPSGNVLYSTDTVCAGSILYVRYNVSGNGPFNVVVDGTELDEQSLSGIIGPIDSIAFMPLSTQPFTMISIQDDSSCMADVSLFTPVTPGVVYEVPVANAGIDGSVCDNAYTLRALKTKPGFIGKWSSPVALFDNASLENAIATVSDFGVYVFSWEETNWRCVDDDEVEITFYEQPQLTDAGVDQELDFIFRTQLSAAPASVGTGKWTIASGAGEFDNDSRNDAIVIELGDENVLKWTISNGNCPVVSDSLRIIVKPLIITRGFTPNGDFKNDVFSIGTADTHNVENIAIKIFNSTGVLVYESDNYLDGEKFTGLSMNGVELPEGTYYYTINIKVIGKEKEMHYRSFVEILR
jgi:gliding motility-associated-like protein